MGHPDHLENDEDTYYEEKSMEELENMVEYTGTELEGLKRYGPSMLAGEHRTVIVVKSHSSGHEYIHRLDIPLKEFTNRVENFRDNRLINQQRPFIQEVFPELTSTQREALMTGISDAEWAELFPKEDEEFEDEAAPYGGHSREV